MGLAQNRIASAGLDEAKTITEIQKAQVEAQKAQVEVDNMKVAQLLSLLNLEQEKNKQLVDESLNRALQEVQATAEMAKSGMSQQEQQLQQPQQPQQGGQL